MRDKTEKNVRKRKREKDKRKRNQWGEGWMCILTGRK